VLAVDTDHPGGAPTVVLAHGFTMDRRCWGELPARLAGHGCEVRRVDLPGHGESGHDTADLWDAADLLVDAGGRGIYLGYSFGARVALHAALAHPDRVAALVLIGGPPGIEDVAERAARRADDERRAARIEEVGTEVFVAEWLQVPLLADLPAAAAHLPERLENRPEGLAASLRHCGTGRQDDLWPRLGQLRMPVLCITGADDERFTAIAGRMAATMPMARAVAIERAGHTVHLQRPDAFWDVLEGWLSDVGDGR
jgi:2-succinyl-6-hydroxy-2,4-cyclohexadiene-1-carboxylate synthase